MVDLEHSTIHSETHWTSVYRRLSYSLGVHCQPVHLYVLHISSIHLTDSLVVMVRIIQKIMSIFLACTVHAGET